MAKRRPPQPYDPSSVRRADRVPAYAWTGRQVARSRVVRPRGIRPNWHLILTLGGTASFRQPGREVPLSRGDAILFTPDCHQDYGPPPGGAWENLFVHFSPRPQWLPWMRWPRVGDGLFLVHLRPAALAHAEAALTRCDAYAHSSFSSFAHELALSALEEAILLGAHEARYAAGEARRSPEVEAAVQAIAADLAERHSVPSLARLAGLSPSRFSHRFKDETGESVIGYINRLRMREAARLLEAEELSVKAVAAAVGFASPFHFSRQFKKWYFLDPTSFRRHAAPAVETK